MPFIQVAVHASDDPMVRCLDARPAKRLALDDFHREAQFVEGRFDGREVDLAIALGRVRIARPQQRTLD